MGTAFLTLGRRWKFAAWQAAVGSLSLAVVVAVAFAAGIPWERTPAFGLYERVVSIADPNGQRDYVGETSFNKGDNNLFRTVWWRAVIDETLEKNPVLGLGFGYDLADRFVREYYPESGLDFGTRSPHNIAITLFGRTGLAGLIPFGVIMGFMAVRTYRAVRLNAPDAAGLWCFCWVILTSAFFGVVLEGPMGAVVFWTVLGMADGESRRTLADLADDSNDETRLPAKAESLSVADAGSPAPAGAGTGHWMPLT